MKPDLNVLKQFNLKGDVIPLPGKEDRTYRTGDVVLKRLYSDTLEYSLLIADCFSKIREEGFRVAKPIPTVDGKWATTDRWSAWTFLEGNHDYKSHIQESINAVLAFHRALRNMPKPEFLEKVNSPYIKADRYTWAQKPASINPDLREMVNVLYELRKPIEGLENQLIHGDLNPNNILVSDTLPPAFIDIAPYWRPVEFALAIYAYWIGPWKDDKEVLNYFSDIKEFNQMLVRAGARMLLIMSEFNKVNNLEKYKRATEIILERF